MGLHGWAVWVRTALISRIHGAHQVMKKESGAVVTWGQQGCWDLQGLSHSSATNLSNKAGPSTLQARRVLDSSGWRQEGMGLGRCCRTGLHYWQ
jgi:hypothetical protein